MEEEKDNVGEEKSYNSGYVPSKCLMGFLLLVAIVVGIIIIIVVVLYFFGSNVGYEYLMMVDAGSSGSRPQVLKFRDFPFRSNSWVQEVNFTRITPGISSYGSDPTVGADKLGQSVVEIIDGSIPSNKKASTSLYLGATAGMRLLNLNNPLQSDAVMEAIRAKFKILGSTLHNEFSDIRIISGEAEGKFAWISINYLLNKLSDENGREPAKSDEFSGVLDLGGASTQIAFIPSNQSSTATLTPVNLFGVKYDLYSYSFLCYGANIAQDRYLAHLLTTNNPVVVGLYDSPCHLRGYSTTRKSSSIFAAPCITSEFAKILTGTEYTPPANLPADVTFSGTGNYGECQTAIRTLFDFATCSKPPCSFNNIPQPPLRGTFIAVSGFFFAIDAFKFPSGGVNLTRTRFAEGTLKFCERRWDEVSTEYPPDQLKFVASYCFNGLYADTLLGGYGFKTDESWMNIQFLDKIAGGTASWSLGYALDATGQIQSRAPKIYLDRVAFIVGITIACAIFLAALIGFIVLLIKYRKWVKNFELNDAP